MQFYFSREVISADYFVRPFDLTLNLRKRDPFRDRRSEEKDKNYMNPGMGFGFNSQEV